MATTNKDFRVKNGLIVEGNSATVNGNQVITSADATNYALLNAANTFSVSPQQININNAANKGLIVKGFASQTENLQEWQDSSGTVLAKVDSNAYFTMGSSTHPGGILGVVAPTASSRPVVIRGATSQSVNLTEWQNSSGTVVSRFSPAGQFNSTLGINAGGAVTTTRLQDATLTSGQIIFTGNSIGTANVNNIMIRALGANQIGLVTRNSLTTNTITAVTANGTTITYTGTNSQFFYPGMTVTITGVVSTGNPTGTAGAGFNLTNATVATATVGTFTVTNSRTDTYTSGGTATAVTTANIQEWQTSAGTVLASVSGTGAFTFPGSTTMSANGNLTVHPNSGVLGFSLFVRSPFASTPVVLVRGIASQTGDLQQWQDSASTVLAKISSNGSITTNSNITQGSAGRTFIGGSADAGAFLNVGIPTASRQGIVVRANASQTANIQEWQNSSGTILSAIDTSGNLTKGDGDQLVLAGQIFG